MKKKKYDNEKPVLGRHQERFKTIPGLSCSIFIPKLNTTEQVMIYDISVAGMAFVVDFPHFEAGEPVVAHLKLSEKCNVFACGEVVGLDPKYPAKSVDSSRAIFKFSMKFDQKIEDESFIRSLNGEDDILDR